MKLTCRLMALALALMMVFSAMAFAEGAEVEQTLYLTFPASNNANTYDFLYPWDNETLPNNLLWLTLIQADKDLHAAQPEIMETWGISEDGTVITMTLKDGLMWSDGTPITMEDVVWTFERYCDPNGKYWSFVVAAMKYIKGYDAFHAGETDKLEGLTYDDKTLTIELSSPYASFLDLMCQVAPLPKHVYENCNFADDSFKVDEIWREITVNSGAFVVTEHSEGSYYVLEPNPYYQGKPSKITKVVCNVAEASNYSTMAQTGNVDMFVSTSQDDYAVMTNTEGYSMKAVPIIFFRFLAFNFFDSEGANKGFVDDVRVRQAFAKGVDWRTVIGGLFGDQASLTQTGVLSDDANYIGDWYEYDPEGAKALLDEAGYDYSHTMKIFYYYTDQTTVDVMDAIAYYMSQIGVTVEAVYTSAVAQDVYEGRTQDIAYFGLSAYDSLSWYQMYLRDNMNDMTGCKAIFADAVAELEVAFSPELKAASLAKLQEMDKENIFFLPVYTLNQQVWLSDRLSVPEDCFGNGWFFYDYQFEDWEIVK